MTSFGLKLLTEHILWGNTAQGRAEVQEHGPRVDEPVSRPVLPNRKTQGSVRPAGDMKRHHVVAGLLLLALLPTASLAATAQSHSHEIETLELQYLAATNSTQRKQFVHELKALSESSDDAS